MVKNVNIWIGTFCWRQQILTQTLADLAAIKFIQV